MTLTTGFKYLSIGFLITNLIACMENKKNTSSHERLKKELTSTPKSLGGIALYTVRDAMSMNPKETLKEIVAIGYKNIEAAGYKEEMYYGMSPVNFKTYLKKLNLEPISTHQASVTLENAALEMAHAKTAGFKYFIVPIPPMGLFTHDENTNEMNMKGTVENLANILNTLGAQAKKAGMELLYHNHDFEFRKNDKGIVPIDYLLQHCDPELVNFQMDLYWVVKAGADPVAYFDRYPNRFKMWHVKDMSKNGNFAPVGTGTIDFENILVRKENSGMLYYMVEQDDTFDLNPMEAIKISRQGIEKIGFK